MNRARNGLMISPIYLLLMYHRIKLKTRGGSSRIGADIAIDLSGWTSNHFLAGFMARLAPIQVNYLGYFASSGLEEIDYWLEILIYSQLLCSNGVQRGFLD